MVSRRSLSWMLAACLLVTSCGSLAPLSPTPAPASEPTSLPDTPTPKPDFTAQLRNADYQLGIPESLRVVKLTDGKYEEGAPGGADYVAVTMLDFAVSGSIDGAGNNQYATLVAENYGGSGTFVFLVVYANENGTPKFLTSRMVDDRPQINELSISDANEIFLDATIHGSQDPMCCPALHTTRHFRINALGNLSMTDYTTFTPDGKPRTINIESPAKGTEVFTAVEIKGSVDIAPFENNLTYQIVDSAGVVLAIGAITVKATELGGPGAFDQTISLGNVLSGAKVRLEVQDLSAEDGTLFAMDSVELVVKSK
jgi:hypothetical protein